MTTIPNLPLSKEELLKSVFNDPKNYPYGFSRSGDFSIAESKALVAYGCYFSALVSGQIKPQSSDDDTLLLALLGDIEPKDTAQRAWVKYQKRINRPKTDSIYGSKKTVLQEQNELVNHTDDDEDVDFDD
ncbi:hypothetical protein GPUN_2637 [Glaciecola punicea ACAM 611]|uniref:Macrodomain Ori protein n=1 Tax=Glaciecola punicea ACAM 611 TaxID=1121923 RepID=H5TEM5_9ALTE|nr:DUF413 domain-containing protein [Glaciecola punicea]GAB56752.1 hypothetical protein GPUN_2637 [Glaciecola punicea ACAM 611]